MEDHDHRSFNLPPTLPRACLDIRWTKWGPVRATRRHRPRREKVALTRAVRPRMPTKLPRTLPSTGRNGPLQRAAAFTAGTAGKTANVQGADRYAPGLSGPEEVLEQKPCLLVLTGQGHCTYSLRLPCTRLQAHSKNKPLSERW